MQETKKELLNHSCAHLMAAAVQLIFPEAKFAIGPSIENGFYYDFDLPRTLVPEDLALIEEKMKELTKKNLPFEKSEVSRKEAIKKEEKAGQIYKAELLKDLPDEKVTHYQTGDFIDLCRGPHVKSTGEIKHFKLLSIAGAYWRGDENRKMLQRIYGTCFETREELKKYLENINEAKKRDHRKIGEELGIFTIDEQVGAGLPIWLPKGTTLRMVIRDFLTKELIKAGYQIVESPHIAQSKLWKTSGHLDFYHDNMYSSFKADEQEFLLKPMNCPFHIVVYKNKMRSYRDLPLKFAEFGTVYRYERSGVLHGLMRVRGFTQDDAHIFCREDQLQEEIKKAVQFALRLLKDFGFSDYDIYLSTKPAKAVGKDEDWEKATEALKKVLNSEQLKYQIDPGEGVFYGPKVDIKIKDSLGRSWQCTTVQLDFNLPERFDLEYIGEDQKKHQPFMIHRALIGSLERFIGVLIEHYGGVFPMWLAPVQAIILPISGKHLSYAKKVAEELRGIRVEIDERNESVGKKIRDAELQKIPFILVVGDKEKNEQNITVRTRGLKDLKTYLVRDFILEMSKLIKSSNF